MAAEWGLTNADAETLARELYVSGNIFQNDIMLGKLPSLPKSCVESYKILLKKRSLYERDGIFPPSIIAYVAQMLDGEKDEHMNRLLVDLPADDGL